jgi:hypothetical protein
MQQDAKNRPIVAYTVEDKYLICIDIERNDPQVISMGDDVEGTIVGSPQAVGGGRWAVTDLGGRVTIYESNSKVPVGSISVGLSGAVPAVASTPLGSSSLLAPFSDGSVVVLPMPKPQAAESEPKPE